MFFFRSKCEINLHKNIFFFVFHSSLIFRRKNMKTLVKRWNICFYWISTWLLRFFAQYWKGDCNFSAIISVATNTCFYLNLIFSRLLLLLFNKQTNRSHNHFTRQLKQIYILFANWLANVESFLTKFGNDLNRWVILYYSHSIK